MKVSNDRLLALLRQSYSEAIDEMSRQLEIPTIPIDRFIESTGEGEMLAAMIGITGEGVRVTATFIVDKPVASGAYAAAYAALRGKTGEDEATLLGDFADMLTESALAKAGITELSVTPAQIMEGRNFKNVPPQKAAVDSFSMPFDLPEGILYVNMSVHA